jgi:2-polyprenyl-6-methoxyphenol hydroxylase-like FAD-dependent oxidoreductase
MAMGPVLADGTVTHTIRRSDLYQGLYRETARRGIAIIHGKRLVKAETAPDGQVTAWFADGSTADGDLLVGADGVHSAARRIIDPAAPGPRYTGLGNVGGFARDVPIAASPGAASPPPNSATGWPACSPRTRHRERRSCRRRPRSSG